MRVVSYRVREQAVAAHMSVHRWLPSDVQVGRTERWWHTGVGPWD